MEAVDTRATVWRLLAYGLPDELIQENAGVTAEQLAALRAELQKIVGKGSPLKRWLKIGHRKRKGASGETRYCHPDDSEG